MPRIVIATVFAILVGILTPPVHGQHTEGEIVARFSKSAATVFDRAKAKPATDGATLLHDFIAEGANRLLSDKRTSDREISAVVELVRRFASEMVKHGVRQSDGSLLWGEASFAAALRSLCPLYPFC